MLRIARYPRDPTRPLVVAETIQRTQLRFDASITILPPPRVPRPHRSSCRAADRRVAPKDATPTRRRRAK